VRVRKSAGRPRTVHGTEAREGLQLCDLAGHQTRRDFACSRTSREAMSTAGRFRLGAAYRTLEELAKLAVQAPVPSRHSLAGRLIVAGYDRF
jgi:hypothetical protein